MTTRFNVGLFYYVAPYINIAKNRFWLAASIILGFEHYTVKFSNDIEVVFEKKQFHILRSILGILSYSAQYTFSSKNTVRVSFDMRNWFTLPLKNFSKEDENLLDLIYQGIRNGADLITDDMQASRKKTIKILDIDNRKVVETANGIKFYLELIHPGNTIIETFVNDIHSISNEDDWNNKIVIDVGAECGDTALYYASKGARVYSFEPIKNNFVALQENLKINPGLAKKITPFNAAIGKDGKLKFYLNPESPDIGASFVYNKYGKDVSTTVVDGYSLKTALEKFKIGHADLLKMDCKGCEFFLTKDDLENIDMVKIEYLIKSEDKKLQDLLKVLEDAGFTNVIYRVNPEQSKSNKMFGHIYGVKNQISRQEF